MKTLKTRRDFLKTTVLGGAATWTVPAFLAHTFSALHAEAADSATQGVTGKDGTILVVLQMAGGNDGLNTVVPFADDNYHRARPRLALKKNGVLKLNDSMGLHPSLAGFKELYDNGHLGIIQGVGYPNPNRSHFRSTEIWQTASDADRFEKHGWLGRYFDSACSGCDPTFAVNIGAQTPQAFAAQTPAGISLSNPQLYRFFSGQRSRRGRPDTNERVFRDLNQPDSGMEMEFMEEDDDAGTIGAISGAARFQGSARDFLERTALDAQVSSDQILAVTGKVQTTGNYPGSQLGNSLKLVAQLIGGGLPTRVFYVSQGGYDTHVNQSAPHERLLKDLGDAVGAFVTDMKGQGNMRRVLVMTFSEFGRRVAENANGGTDHGAAAPLFVIGNKIKPGLLGRYPSLASADLRNGDLRFNIDFRSVYAGVLEHWLKTGSEAVLGRKFEPVKFV